MKKFVMAIMMCIGLGAGNSAMAADVAGNEAVDFMMQMMGDTCALAGKVIITDRLNGVSQQQAKDTFQAKYMQEFNTGYAKAVNLEKIYAVADNPKLDPEMANDPAIKITKAFSDQLIPNIFTLAWQIDKIWKIDNINEIENKNEFINEFSKASASACQTQVYETLQEAVNAN